METLARDGGGGRRRLQRGVCFYGSRMDASLAPRLAAPVLFVCGDGDPLCGVETVRALEARARAPGPPCTPAGGTGSRTGRSRWRTTATPRTRSR